MNTTKHANQYDTNIDEKLLDQVRIRFVSNTIVWVSILPIFRGLSNLFYIVVNWDSLICLVLIYIDRVKRRFELEVSYDRD